MGEWLNPATLALAMILTTAAAAIWVGLHRDLFFPASEPQRRRPPVRRAQPRPQPETKPKPQETVSAHVSGVLEPKLDTETVSLRTIAKLVKAGHVQQTVAIESVFGVNAGSSKEYQRLRGKFLTVAAELDETERKNRSEVAPKLQ